MAGELLNIESFTSIIIVVTIIVTVNNISKSIFCMREKF